MKRSKMPKETINAVAELGEVLRGIHNRLLLEGKIIIKDGKTIFLEGDFTKKTQK